MQLGYLEASLAIIGALVSVFSAAWAFYSGRKTHDYAVKADASATRAHENLMDASREAKAVSEESNYLAAIEVTNQYLRAVRSWGEAASLALTHGALLSEIEDHGERRRSRREVRAKLSSLIDTGRWYFPNEYCDDYGTEKPLAYRGIRKPVLGHLVKAYRILETDPLDEASVKGLIQEKKNFISEIQAVLDPRRRSQTLDTLDEQFREVERMK